MKEYNGIFVKVLTHENKYFDNIVAYILEYFDTLEYSDAVILVSTPIHHRTKDIKAKFPDKRIILYNWEQFVGNNVYLNITKYIDNMEGADEIWDYDELNAKYLSWYKVRVDKIYPFRYTKRLENVVNAKDPKIDVLFYGYMNDVRLRKFAQIYPSLYHDYSIMTISGMNRDEQIKYIGDSKIILNIHGMEPYARQEQDRIAYSLINSKCVVSETSQVNYFEGLIVEAEVKDLADVIKDTLAYDRWKSHAVRGNIKFKEIK